MSTQKTIVGTLLRMSVSFSYPTDPTVTLDTIDWKTEWYTSGQKITLTKSQHIREVSGSTVTYYALLDTATLGFGTLKMRLWAEIPDADVEGGIRPEYAEVTTNVTIG